MLIDIERLRREVEDKNGLPYGLLSAVAKAESNNDPRAISPAGAMGMYQFMPETAKDLGIDPFDVEQSTRAAGEYLSDLQKQTGSLEGALAAYNWGIGNVKRKGMENIPAETQSYIPKVMGLLKQGYQSAVQATSDRMDYLSDEFSKPWKWEMPQGGDRQVTDEDERRIAELAGNMMLPIPAGILYKYMKPYGLRGPWHNTQSGGVPMYVNPTSKEMDRMVQEARRAHVAYGGSDAIDDAENLRMIVTKPGDAYVAPASGTLHHQMLNEISPTGRRMVDWTDSEGARLYGIPGNEPYAAGEFLDEYGKSSTYDDYLNLVQALRQALGGY